MVIRTLYAVVKVMACLGKVASGIGGREGMLMKLRQNKSFVCVAWEGKEGIE